MIGHRSGYVDSQDYYRRGPLSGYQGECRLAGSRPVSFHTLKLPAGDFVVPGLPEFSLRLTLSGGPVCMTDFGFGRSRKRISRGNLALAPPDMQTRALMEGPHQVLVISFPKDSLGPHHGSVPDFGRLHAASFRDPFIESLSLRLWEEAAHGSSAGTLFADSAIQTLVLALWRKAEPFNTVPDPARGTPLASWRLQRCLDYICDNLSEDVGLGELAAAAGLSPLYFAKAFKRGTGIAPHQYLVRQRVERAKDLLVSTDLSVADVAVACGFYDQSHLASWFRRLVGTTPTVFRADR